MHWLTGKYLYSFDVVFCVHIISLPFTFSYSVINFWRRFNVNQSVRLQPLQMEEDDQNISKSLTRTPSLGGPSQAPAWFVPKHSNTRHTWRNIKMCISQQLFYINVISAFMKLRIKAKWQDISKQNTRKMWNACIAVLNPLPIILWNSMFKHNTKKPGSGVSFVTSKQAINLHWLTM